MSTFTVVLVVGVPLVLLHAVPFVYEKIRKFSAATGLPRMMRGRGDLPRSRPRPFELIAEGFAAQGGARWSSRFERLVSPRSDASPRSSVTGGDS